MVERIVAAGRAVLAEDGYDACSTNRIAARAGVSPGSIYQYFPDKAAIVAAVIEGWSDETAERVAASLADRVGEPGGIGMVRATIEALLSALEADPELLRVVSEELPLAQHKDRRTALERRVRERGWSRSWSPWSPATCRPLGRGDRARVTSGPCASDGSAVRR